jgi:macrodomain Ter protein organizer (MatP/YcbG family)
MALIKCIRSGEQIENASAIRKAVQDKLEKDLGPVSVEQWVWLSYQHVHITDGPYATAFKLQHGVT